MFYFYIESWPREVSFFDKKQTRGHFSEKGFTRDCPLKGELAERDSNTTFIVKRRGGDSLHLSIPTGKRTFCG